VVFPLSAGRMVSLVFCLRFCRASLSFLVRFSLGRTEFFIILTVSCLASSAFSTGRGFITFSTPVKLYSPWCYCVIEAFL
jgi:hypothetical protein